MKKLGLIALCLGFLGTTTAWGKHHKGRHHRKHMKAEHKKLMKDLKLTEDQKAKFEEIKQTAKKEKESFKSARKALRSELQKGFANNANSDALRNTHNKLVDLRIKVKKARFENMLKKRALLTKEQLTVFNEKKSKHFSREPANEPQDH